MNMLMPYTRQFNVILKVRTYFDERDRSIYRRYVTGKRPYAGKALRSQNRLTCKRRKRATFVSVRRDMRSCTSLGVSQCLNHRTSMYIHAYPFDRGSLYTESISE